jgi:tetratricopeptide (TPR) repeat protein
MAESLMPESAAGRIITFYSYKGGTGRSMALANIAWILASNGLRVLAIDWDLEGPGLHRYFHPFLRDKELTNCEGLIDFVVDFATAAMAPSKTKEKADADWFLPYANLMRYAVSLDTDVFPALGTLDFVPAGRQDAGYPVRVNGFNWRDFYEKLGGGVFLEAVKRRLRQEYDYIVIDSRTGVSDTSGICTVQMPDDLVVCFTLNTQSIEGAAAAAASALAQRRKEDGQPALHVWPVPTRVELGEKEKLEFARHSAREHFDRFLERMSPAERDQYWGTIEVLYQPYYAYEEVLATFADTPGQSTSLLASMETITARLTDQRIARLGPLQEEKRRKLLGLYLRQYAVQHVVQPVWNVPLLKNPLFTGRDDIMQKLEGALKSTGAAALSGLGGIGKTQTAAEYAYRHRDQYPAVLWASAASRETLASGFVALAALLNLPESKEKEQELAVAAVKRWLEANAGWLLILDNANDLPIAREFIPKAGKGHLLLTTRLQATGGLAKRVEIQSMEPEEGALFLLRRARVVGEQAPLTEASAADRKLGEAISEKVGGHPLALDQAGAYIEETGCGLESYLELYRQSSAELFRMASALGSEHPSVAATFASSFEKVEQVNPAAAELLRLCAFLHPDAIPEEIITEGAAELGPTLQPVAADPLKLNGVVAETLKYSLLRRDPAAKTLSIHGLVQAVLQHGMDAANQREWSERAVRAVNQAFPDVEFSNWGRCERLLPQALASADLIDEKGLEFPEAARLLNETGHYLYERARYAEAQPLYQRALEIGEKTQGPEHPAVAASFNNLAELYRSQGKYGEAEPLYQRALEIREKALGPEHPDVALSLNNLAELYQSQGKYGEAEPLYRQALRIREKTLGPEHPDVATSLDNLAVLYDSLGKYAGAEPLSRRALAIREKALGPEHPNVARSLNNLAGLYKDRGNYGEAEQLYQQALKIREKALGPDHPNVATSLNNLAFLYSSHGKYDEAEPLYQRALAIREKALGPDHPNLATSLNNLAFLYSNQGKYGEAEPLYQRALRIREKVLGPDHPNVAMVLNNYAVLLRKTNRRQMGIKLQARAEAIRAKHAKP